jgi:nitric oxide reductase NorQ protein
LFNCVNRTETALFFALREVQQFEHWRGVDCSSFEDYCSRLGLNQQAVDAGLRALDEFLAAGCDDAELVAAGLPTIIALRNALESSAGRWDGRRRNKLLRLVRERGLLPGQLQDQQTVCSLLAEVSGPRVRSARGKRSPAPLEEQPSGPAASLEKLTRPDWLSRISAQILNGPPTRWPDPPLDFSVKPEHWRQLVLTVHLHQNGLLVGPTGSGKSQLIKRLAEALQRPYFSFNLGGTLDPRSELLGTTQLRAGQTTFCDAHFLRALQTPGAIIALDELNRCDGMFLNLLNPILDGQRTVVIGERLDAPVVELAEGISFFGIANVGPEYAHTVPLDRAIVDRFDINLPIEYPSQQEEEQLLRQHFPRLDRTEAKKLAQLASQQRQQAQRHEYNLYVSTRMLFAVAARTSGGGSLWEAVEYAITTKLSDSGEGNSQRLKFRLLAQKLLGSAA